MAKKTKTPQVKRTIARKSFLGVSTWSGPHLVDGFCGTYETTYLVEEQGKAPVYETVVERGEPVYLGKASAQVAALFDIFRQAENALRNEINIADVESNKRAARESKRVW